MDKIITKLNKAAAKTMGDGADYIIIAQKDGQCGGTILGNVENIAQAFFALIHQDNELAKAVYRIIKLNVMNIINNPSPFAMDLSGAISNLVPESDE